MHFDIYGRFHIEVRREGGAWAVYRQAPGRRVPCADVIIPAHLSADEISIYLDDIYHELASPGDQVTQIGP